MLNFSPTFLSSPSQTENQSEAGKFQGFPGGSAGKESACNVGDLGSIPGLGRSGEWNSYPPQYSGLENSMDCTVHGVEKSRTRLSDFHFTRQFQSLPSPIMEPMLSQESCVFNIDPCISPKLLSAFHSTSV